MEYGVAFLAGIFHKLYDDIHDNNVELSSLSFETIKLMMVATMTMFLMQNPIVSVFVFLAIGIYGWLGKIDTDVWKACIPISFVIFLVQWKDFLTVASLTTLSQLFFFMIIAFGMYVEDKLFPEETSISKSLFRIGIVFGSAGVLWFSRNLSLMTSSFPIVFFIIGYLLTSILFHYKTLLSVFVQTPSSQSTSLAKETMNTEILPKQTEVSDSPSQDDAHSRASDSYSVPLKPLEAE
jgi:hypothetical protein